MEIRNEQPSDYREVEELTRQAFWNVSVPGCSEHYLAHILRSHPDFIPELDFILKEDNKIIANVMFTKATITNEYGLVKKVVSFGPLSVLPDYQRKGYGTALLNYAFAKTLELGYDVVIIYGDPENYICHGFRSCRHYHIHVYGAVCPTALLVKELKKNAIAKADYWSFHDSPV